MVTEHNNRAEALEGKTSKLKKKKSSLKTRNSFSVNVKAKIARKIKMIGKKTF